MRQLFSVKLLPLALAMLPPRPPEFVVKLALLFATVQLVKTGVVVPDSLRMPPPTPAVLPSYAGFSNLVQLGIVSGPPLCPPPPRENAWFPEMVQPIILSVLPVTKKPPPREAVLPEIVQSLSVSDAEGRLELKPPPKP